MAIQLESRTEYSKSYTGFCGVDFTNDAANVSTKRFSYLENMYRDYDSEMGAAVETVPGYRRLYDFGGKINGIYKYRSIDGIDYMVIHAGTNLYKFAHSDRDNLSVSAPTEYSGLANNRSSAFIFNSKLYLLDGAGYFVLDDNGLSSISDVAYVPISYADGEPYEQRNMLSDKFINKFNVVDPETFGRDADIYTYTYDDVNSTATVTGTVEQRENMIIPTSVEYNSTSYSVTAIADEAFISNIKVKKVILPPTVTTIGEYAFYECGNLTTVVFSGVETIKSRAFNGCNIKGIYIPDSCTDIGAYSFYNNSNLEKIIFGSGINTIGNGAFYSCEAVTNIYTVMTETAFNSITFGINWVSNIEECTITYETTINNIALNSETIINDTTFVASSFESYGGLASLSSNETNVILIANGVGFVIFLKYYESSDDVEVFYNVTGTATPIDNTYKEYVFPLYDPCKSIDKITTEGVEINSSNISYKAEYEGEYITSIVFLASAVDILTDCDLKIYGTGFASEFTSIAEQTTYKESNPEYSGSAYEAVTKCTVSCIFDGRVFLTGNSTLPNTIFYAQRDLTGHTNPSYIGILNYINDGTGNTENVAMIATSSLLMVFKGDTVQDGSVYYHSGLDSENDLIPRIYPSSAGLAGIGCLGSACNFLDDAVFISKRGLDAIGKETVNLERTVEHRSSMVDFMLKQEALSSVSLCEWNGYLCILCPSNDNTRIYLADSRQLFTGVESTPEYEWYCMFDIGTYIGQVDRYRYIQSGYATFNSIDYPLEELYDKDGDYCYPLEFLDSDEYIGAGEQSCIIPSYYSDGAYHMLVDENFNCIYVYVKYVDGHAYVVDTDGEKIGGTYSPASAIAEANGILYFGTNGGSLCCFNTDKRGLSVNDEVVRSDEIHRTYYTFDGRRYDSGCSTCSDAYGIPYYTKTTAKNSVVLRLKTFIGSKVKMKCRKDMAEWIDIETTTNTELNYYDTDYGNFTFGANNVQICVCRERVKKWIEKQYYLYSDEYMKPFGLYSIAGRYYIAGRVRL